MPEELENKIQEYLDENFKGEYAPYKKIREMAKYFFNLGFNSKKK